MTATVANIKIRYDAKTPQFAVFGTRVIYVFYSIRFIVLYPPKRSHDLPPLSRLYTRKPFQYPGGDIPEQC